MKVIMYGSQQFTPTDLPAGATFSRGNLTHMWSMTVAEESLQWRTSTDWSDGWYIRADFDAGSWGSAPANLQDSNWVSGAETWANWSNPLKTLLARAGMDPVIPSNATISYVRIWVSFRHTGNGEMRAYWEVIGSRSGESTSVVGGNSGFIGTQDELMTGVSPKLTTSPYGSVFTGEVLKHTGWGVGLGSGPVNGTYWELPELGVEVAYELVTYTVTTGDATPSTDRATLRGTLVTNGDSPATFWWEYGTTPNLGSSTTPGSYTGGGTSSFTQLVTSLSSGVTYYYRFVGRSSSGGTYYGATQTFMTIGGTLPILVL